MIKFEKRGEAFKNLDGFFGCRYRFNGMEIPLGEAAKFLRNNFCLERLW